MNPKTLISSDGRVCTICNKFKLYDEFAKHSTSFNKHHSACKGCTNRLREKKQRNIILDNQLKEEIVHKKELAHEYWHGVGELIPSYRPIKNCFFK